MSSSEYEASPMPMDPSEIPDISFTEYVFDKLKNHPPEISSRPLLVELLSGDKVLFGDIEEHSRKIASALSRLGLGHGDILYYVTYNMTQVYIAMLAAWRVGAAVRGCYQREEAEEYKRQMHEGNVKIVLVDAETAPVVKDACKGLDWKVTLVSLGPEPVSDATPYSELLKDDGSAFPENVTVNPREDVVFIPNTSGSTGFPKGAMHTHYSYVSVFYCTSKFSVARSGGSQFTLASNYLASNFFAFASSLFNASTVYYVSKYSRDKFIDQLLQCKVDTVMMYPYLAAWFVRSPEVAKHDFSFLKLVGIGGSILDPTTANLLPKIIPNVMFLQAYAMSEVGIVSSTLIGITSPEEAKKLRTCEFEGKAYSSVGKPYPYTLVKIVDPEKGGKHLGRMKSGEIVVKAPYVMKGYLVRDGPPNRKDIDDEGWLYTGDLGFFDQDGYLYVQERKTFNFKYYMFFVSPTEIETILSEHPAVREVGVVGVPNEETTNLTRACVVLKPGEKATEDDMKEFVAKRLPSHLHLHGGVGFLESLPVNRGGKVDRIKLREIAIQGMHKQETKQEIKQEVNENVRNAAQKQSKQRSKCAIL